MLIETHRKLKRPETVSGTEANRRLGPEWFRLRIRYRRLAANDLSVLHHAYAWRVSGASTGLLIILLFLSFHFHSTHFFHHSHNSTYRSLHRSQPGTLILCYKLNCIRIDAILATS